MSNAPEIDVGICQLTTEPEVMPRANNAAATSSALRPVLAERHGTVAVVLEHHVVGCARGALLDQPPERERMLGHDSRHQPGPLSSCDATRSRAFGRRSSSANASPSS